MFRKAEKRRAKLRLALMGPAGSGKTFTALRVARGLVGENGRIALLDTEHGSSEKYAGEHDFDVCPIDRYSPADYLRVIQAAEEAGYDCLIIDSLSHEWAGEGGILNFVDNDPGRNKFSSAWGKATPMHLKFIESILKPKMHIIGTLRVKMAYEIITNDRGKKEPVKIGLAPVTRAGMEYEFDVLGAIDLDGTLTVQKTRCSALRDYRERFAGEAFGETLRAWLEDGTAPVAPAPPPEDNSPRGKLERWGQRVLSVHYADLDAFAADQWPNRPPLEEWPAEQLREVCINLGCADHDWRANFDDFNNRQENA